MTDSPTPRDGLDSGSIAHLVEDSRAIHLPQFPAAGPTPAHVDEDLFGTFGEKWQAGKVPDLQQGLEQLDSQIAKQLQLG